jgi:hypothetical protein
MPTVVYFEFYFHLFLITSLVLTKRSPIPKLLTHSSNSVTKLTDRKIRWIIREKMKEILSTKDIALLQNVSASRIRQIWCRYRITKTVPILAKPGRPSRDITNKEMSAVIGGATVLTKRYALKLDLVYGK